MASADPLKSPEIKELQTEAKNLATLARTYQVSTPVQYAAAAEDLRRVKGALSRLDVIKKKITQPMGAAKRAVLDLFRGPEEELTRAEGGIKRVMIAYNDEQLRIQRAEQAKVEAAARAERERNERAAADARRKAEEDAAQLRRDAEAAAAAGRTAEAAKLAARADQKIERAEVKAEGLEMQARTVVAPIIHRETPKVSGLSDRRVWKFRVVDPAKVPREFLMVDEVKLGRYVRAMRESAKVEGVEVYDEGSLASSAA